MKTFNTSQFKYNSREKTLTANYRELTAGMISVSIPESILIKSDKTNRTVQFNEVRRGKKAIFEPAETLPGVEKVIVTFYR